MNKPLCLLILLFFVACGRKETTSPAPSPSGQGGTVQCVPLPVQDQPWQGWNGWCEPPCILSPRWNPENANEFLFIESGSVSKLWKYNMVNNGLHLIAEANFLTAAEWGINDWIAINPGWPAEIYKIKSNGDSLIQLTFDGNNFGPLWSYDYDRIAYYHMDNITRVMDLEGNLLGEISPNCGFTAGGTSWGHPELLALCMGGLYTCDPETGEVNYLISDPDIGNYWGLSFTNDLDQIAWVSFEGLHRTSVSTAETTTVQETCDSRFYYSIDCHRSNNKLLLLEVTRTPHVPVQFALRSTFKVYTMNLDGSGKQEINIPFPE